jgi:predicted AlkP superfamily phosphohydrolase/phosphomutase
MADGRLLAIALDAVDRDFLTAHLGRLPHIARLLAEGQGGELESEAMSGSVWTSFFTRSGPGAHGVFDQLQWDPQGMRIARSDAALTPNRPFWRDLEAPVICLDIPVLYPGSTPPEVVEICNWGSHDVVGPFWCSDPALGRRFRREVGRSPMGGQEIPVPKTAKALARLRDDLARAAALRASAVRWLMRERPWRLFVVSFGEIHRAGHNFGGDWQDGAANHGARDDLLKVYEAVDAAIGEMTAAAPDADVMLFSLHGMGPNVSQRHHVPVFLERAFAKFRGEAAPADKGEPPGLVRALRRAIPARLQLAIAERTPMAVRDEIVARELTGGLDWPTTFGFCLHGDVSALIRLNLAGREAKGALSVEEADRLLDFLAAETRALTLPDGEPLVAHVSYPARELQGERAHLLPDMAIEWRSGAAPAEAIHSPSLGVIRARFETGRGGNHRFDPFWRLCGPRAGRAFPPPRHVSELADVVCALV